MGRSLRWSSTMWGLVIAGALTVGTPAMAGSDKTSTETSTTDASMSDAPIGHNSIVLGTQFKIPDFGTSLTYQRALTRRLSVGFGLEYSYQAPGYWHLQGVGENVSTQFWLGRAFNGVFAEGSLGVMHQFLARQPQLSTTALAPGLSLGYRWTHRSGLSVGGSAGLRWGRVVQDSDLVCSRPKYCTAVRTGPYTRITLDLGYVF